MPVYSFDLAAFAKRTVLGGIDAATNKAERKERIMLARQCGFLTDEEAEEWIVAADLGSA